MSIKLRDVKDNVDGKPREYYVQKYWEKLCPLPKEDNPVWNNDGKKDDKFNSILNEPLYMLSPSMNPQTPVVRKINVPENNKGLLIPMMGVVASWAEIGGDEKKLVAAVKSDQLSIQTDSMSLDLDDQSYDLEDIPYNYNIKPGSMKSFQVRFPEDPERAVFSIFHPGEEGPAVAAGRYVWTEPIKKGKHHVKYKGLLTAKDPDCIESAYCEDILYLIDCK